MKNLNNKFLYVLALATSLSLQAYAQTEEVPLKRCASTEQDSFRLLKKPSLINLRNRSEQIIEEHINLKKARLRTSADVMVTIPVIVHVVHSRTDQRIGGAGNGNITDFQIQSQIDVLNEDYGNTSGYKGFYTDSLAVDTGIRFKLAGITRHYSNKTQFSPVTDADDLANIAPAWFTNRFLNIWVCRLNDGYLGTSQFPVVTQVTDQTSGLATEGEDIDALTDGVIIDYRYFGRNSDAITSRIYDLGRTTTHEVGHWLGLLHIWGDRNCGTDYCDDTPTAYTKNETIDTSCTPVFSECRSNRTRNMIENYMDYSPDICMSVFTNDQKERMHAVLELSPRRAKLVEYSKISGEDMLVELYPNPVSDILYSNVFTPDFASYTVSIFNQRGQRLTKDTVNRTSLNVQSFPSGLYYYRVSTDKQTLIKSFLVK